MTTFLEGVRSLSAGGGPVVVTVGTFDGVHLGHRRVLDAVVARAAAVNGRSVLVTFDPHPLRVVRPSHAPPLLTTLEEKKVELAKARVDYVVIVPFTKALQQFSPVRFVTEVLLDGLGMNELIIGYDHGFGRGRSGDVGTLRAIARERGFVVDVVNAVDSVHGTISSSAIRRALLEGRPKEANSALGRAFTMAGAVVRGVGRGRELGFPTANLDIQGPHKLIPAHGIYSCFTHLPTGQMMGAMHIGPRPTFPGTRDTVEVHVLDYDGDLYGEVIRLELVEFLRPVAAFDSGGALVEQMRADVMDARRSLTVTHPAGDA